MKHLQWMAVLLTLLVTTACEKNDNYRYYQSLGVVAQDGSILTDLGNSLIITENKVQSSSLKEGKRLIVQYDILSETEQSGKKIVSIRLLGYAEILTKDVMLESFIKEDEVKRNDSVGNDPISITGITFSGGYANIQYTVRHTPTGPAHLINLVYDDVKQTQHGDTLYLTLRHNDGLPTEPSQYTPSGSMASFPMKEIVDPKATKVPVRFIWKDLSGKEQFIKEDYTL